MVIYPANIKSLMVNINKLIKFTKDSDMHLISKSGKSAHKYKKEFEELDQRQQHEILPDFDVFNNDLSLNKSYKLFKKNLNIPDYSKLGIIKYLGGDFIGNSSYEAIHQNYPEYLKYLVTEDIVFLIIGLIEAENQNLYNSGSTSQIYRMFEALREREYEDVDELEQWAEDYARNPYVPTGGSTTTVASTRIFRARELQRIKQENEDKQRRKEMYFVVFIDKTFPDTFFGHRYTFDSIKWKENAPCTEAEFTSQLNAYIVEYINEQTRQNNERIKQYKEERLERINKENEAKKLKQQEAQAKNNKYRNELIKQLEYFKPYERLIVIYENDMPPYYFPISFVDNITDEEIKKIPDDVKQQMISRIQCFDKAKSRKILPKIGPWREFSYRLIARNQNQNTGNLSKREKSIRKK